MSIECVFLLYLYFIYPIRRHLLISCNSQGGFLFLLIHFLIFREGEWLLIVLCSVSQQLESRSGEPMHLQVLNCFSVWPVPCDHTVRKCWVPALQSKWNFTPWSDQQGVSEKLGGDFHRIIWECLLTNSLLLQWFCDPGGAFQSYVPINTLLKN